MFLVFLLAWPHMTEGEDPLLKSSNEVMYIVGVHDPTFWQQVYPHTHTRKLELFKHFRARLFQWSINPNNMGLEQMCFMWREYIHVCVQDDTYMYFL